MLDVDVLITSLLFACKTAITAVPVSFNSYIPNEEPRNIRQLESRGRIMLSLSHLSITQQPSNQAKKWHNEDVNVCSGVCEGTVGMFVYLGTNEGRFQ